MIRKNNISEQKTRVKTDVEKTENDNRKLYT